jgi:hypothetical protein
LFAFYIVNLGHYSQFYLLIYSYHNWYWMNILWLSSLYDFIYRLKINGVLTLFCGCIRSEDEDQDDQSSHFHHLKLWSWLWPFFTKSAGVLCYSAALRYVRVCMYVCMHAIFLIFLLYYFINAIFIYQVVVSLFLHMIGYAVKWAKSVCVAAEFY